MVSYLNLIKALPKESVIYAYGLKHIQASIPVNQGLPHCVLEFYSWVLRTRPSQGGRFQSLALPYKSGSLALYIGDLPKISFEKQERFLILKGYENCTVTMLCFILKSTLSIRKLCDYTTTILIPGQ